MNDDHRRPDDSDAGAPRSATTPGGLPIRTPASHSPIPIQRTSPAGDPPGEAVGDRLPEARLPRARMISRLPRGDTPVARGGALRLPRPAQDRPAQDRPAPPPPAQDQRRTYPAGYDPLAAAEPAARGPRRFRLLSGGVVALVLVVSAALWFGRDRAGSPAPAAAGPTTVNSVGSVGAATSAAVLPGPPSSPAGSVSPATRTPSPSATVTTTTRAATTTTSKPSPSATPKGQANESGANLALRRPARTSGIEGEPWAAANAVDGDAETRWSSAFSDPQWLTIDLGAVWQISQVRISWEHAYATAYRIDLSTNGAKWTSTFQTTAGSGGVVVVRPGKKPARYVRVFGTKRNTQYGYSVLELDVR